MNPDPQPSAGGQEWPFDAPFQFVRKGPPPSATATATAVTTTAALVARAASAAVCPMRGALSRMLSFLVAAGADVAVPLLCATCRRFQVMVPPALQLCFLFLCPLCLIHKFLDVHERSETAGPRVLVAAALRRG